MAATTHPVTIDSTGERFACAEDVNVLAAMERARCAGIPVGCRNGGCGACKVRVVEGAFHAGKMNRAVVSAEEQEQGCVLACRVFPRGELRLQVLGRVWRGASPSRTASSGFGFARTPSQTRPDQET